MEADKILPIKIVETPSAAGVVYTMRQEFRAGGLKSKEEPVVVERTFDPAAGYNVTSSKMTLPGGKIDEEQVWEYTTVSGIYIPKRHQRKKYHDKSEKLLLRRELTLADAKINEPLDEDVFTWNSLGLQHADQIQDKIEGTTLRYQHGELVPAAEFVEETLAGPPAGRGRFFVVVIANLAFVLVVIGVIIAYRYRKARLGKGS